MSKHHTQAERSCVGGRWAGSDAAHPNPCMTRFEHVGECDGSNCPGCRPRQAESGYLCGTCHRYLAQWLADEFGGAAWLYGWLTERMAPLKSPAAHEDWQRAGTAEDLPSVLNEAIFDCRQLLSDRIYIAEERAREVFGEEKPDEPFDFAEGVAYLRNSILRIEDEPDLVAHIYTRLQDSMIIAHGLAPWRRTAVVVRDSDGPIACPHCERKALKQFGGDDFVTCEACGVTIISSRFDIWTEMIKEGRG